MRKVIIDCDPGIDDAIALITAIKDPRLDILAVTAVTGNLPVDRTAENARKILNFMGVSGIPVAAGPMAPLSREYPADPFSHGDNGLANVEFPEAPVPLVSESAAEMIVRTVNAHPHEVTILALGPLTNLALALQLDPQLPEKVKDVVAIAGSFGLTPYAWTQATGDNPVSEWNVFVDPGAAKTVFEAGFEFTAIGLDVATHTEVNLGEADFARLQASSNPEAKFAVQVVEFVRNRNYQSYCALIDTMAIAYVTEPQLFGTRDLRCSVETQGEFTLGMTVFDIRNHHRWDHFPLISVVAEVDFRGFLDYLVNSLTK